jgi:hypothetical protein
MTLRLFSLFALLLFASCASTSSSTSSSTTRPPNWVCEVPAIGGALLLDVPRLDVLDFELVELQAGIRVRDSSTVLRMQCVQAVDVRSDALPPSTAPAASPPSGP